MGGITGLWDKPGQGALIGGVGFVTVDFAGGCAGTTGAHQTPFALTPHRGVQKCDRGFASIIGGVRDHGVMMLSFLYLPARRLMALLTWRARGDAAKELEIVVLQHQVAVLRRR